ncbi:xanthine and CO dehydrogenases maturation factor, XdhC/CoxF family [Desulfosporosinus acidiphilus SJ4]|uniref:Xanthine and CO dehydrogenases maturation factor, XdhC/CoxF family n=1 Tax=Desulfosporosinus acidiphilus (strain DSM 22704 / JCM 16185 / SJ4) TaxID=646529 RepID=I4D521_DESAJ|nr:XdhC/CoxI family protein [Desulfosporosinus acidiphilus]AFM40895.1 xanthine and CO dehydrogenases maturation factor, XdhC/CoxF family [Desulfosporosinus acidiphilus SJ4]
MEKEVFQGLKKVFEQNIEAALITICSVLGSTPRKPGTKMLVFPDGTTVGTIGGGCGEAEARREALNVLTSRKTKLHSLNMTADLAQDEGMVCGGLMGLLIEYLGPQTPAEQIKFYQDYLAALENQKSPYLLTVLEAPEKQLIGKKLFTSNTGEALGDLGLEQLNQTGLDYAQNPIKYSKPVLITLDTEFAPLEGSGSKASYRLLLEPPSSSVELLILGAGHIALPLAAMAKILGYEITVVDDRPSFANAGRFHMADRVICDDFATALDTLTISPETFVVIITRGHRYDKVCLRKIITQQTAYVGMIGSRRRVNALKAELEKEGIPKQLLQKLYSPIGLNIGAETPEEIAVCILGELIKVQKGV